VIELFYRDKLVRRLIICLDDQIEKNREIAIEILIKAVERVGLKDEAQILLPAIAARMNKIPFLEKSEEVRMSLIELLQACLDSDKNQFIMSLGDVGGMLGRACSDENPEMKQKVASMCASLCRELP